MNKKTFFFRAFSGIFALFVVFSSCKKSNEVLEETSFHSETSTLKANQQNLTSVMGCDVFLPNYTAGSCGWPTNWIDNYVVPKHQATELIDTVYYKRSLIRVDAAINFPFGITSPNNKYSLIGQTDGSLIVRDNSNNKILWDAKSNEKYGTTYPYRLKFKNDGDLVVYANKNGTYSDVVWNTNNLLINSSDFFFPIIPVAAMYILKDDGNLVLFRDVNKTELFTQTVVYLHPVAETGTTNGIISSHFKQIK